LVVFAKLFWRRWRSLFVTEISQHRRMESIRPPWQTRRESKVLAANSASADDFPLPAKEAFDQRILGRSWRA